MCDTFGSQTHVHIAITSSSLLIWNVYLQCMHILHASTLFDFSQTLPILLSHMYFIHLQYIYSLLSLLISSFVAGGAGANPSWAHEKSTQKRHQSAVRFEPRTFLLRGDRVNYITINRIFIHPCIIYTAYPLRAVWRTGANHHRHWATCGVHPGWSIHVHFKYRI